MASSSSSSSSTVRRSKRKRVERVINDDKISETAIARRLGRRLRSMTQLLREDTPQASAILTNGINRKIEEPRIRNKDNNHTTNIGDIIKSAGTSNNDDESGQDTDNNNKVNDVNDDVTELIRYNCYNRNNNINNSGTHPQLKFDESGNIVIEEVSDNKDDDRGPSIGTINQLMETRDESGQNAYKYAYKKSIGGKWSKEETNLFYKGLQLYGPDLMLISTVFGSTKTTSQLRQKLKAEAKRNPKRLNEALKNKREINIQEFEKAHGPISNSEEGGNGGGGILSNTCICTDNVVFDYEADLARILEGCLP